MEDKPFPFNEGKSPFENLPRMTADEYRDFRHLNRALLRPHRPAKTEEPQSVVTEPVVEPQAAQAAEPESKSSGVWRPRMD
jgi:hypothetical protein